MATATMCFPLAEFFSHHSVFSGATPQVCSDADWVYYSIYCDLPYAELQ